MPTNKYTCECGHEWQFIGPSRERYCPKCSALVKPNLPREVNTPSVMEVIDKDRNVKWRDDFREKAEKRNAFYNKKTAKEKARVHNENPEKFGITEDDPHMV